MSMTSLLRHPVPDSDVLPHPDPVLAAVGRVEGDVREVRHELHHALAVRLHPSLPRGGCSQTMRLYHIMKLPQTKFFFVLQSRRVQSMRDTNA